MLIEFSVKNFRSIAAKQTFSMVLSDARTRKHKFALSTGHKEVPYVTNVASIFGPNGSGKSNLIAAMGFLKVFVRNSSKDSQEGEDIDIDSFKLDPAFRNKPSEFEIVFTVGDNLYQYGFSVDKNRVHGEWLYQLPSQQNAKLRAWFERKYSKRDYEWNISSRYIKGDKETWRNATRDNALFLSTAIQLNAEALREPYEWIQQNLQLIGSTERFAPTFTMSQIFRKRDKDKIVDIVKAIDVGIHDIRVEESDLELDKLEEVLSEKILKDMKKEGRKNYKASTVYVTNAGSKVELNFLDESAGTQIVFALAGPWVDVLKKGLTLIVDELNNSLHPYALKYLIGLFYDKKVNKKGAQLVFTCHDTFILADEFLNKDQIWVVDREPGRETRLTPLSDFKVRTEMSFQKAYLGGRFGGVPKIRGELVHG